MAENVRTRVVFVSYAHEDDDLRRRLDIVLKPLVRKARLDIWADDRIGVSRVWSDEIEANLARAEIAVLLVSADFLASDYIMDLELPRLVDRGVPLVCIPVGPCGWHDVEGLERVQWPLPPERPLAAMSREERDGALMAVYDALAGLRGHLDAADGESPQAPTPRLADELVCTAPGHLVGVPPLPATYQNRPGDLDALKQRLRTRADVGLVGRTAAMGLHGRGGVGKSVLAAALCHEDDVRSWFPDGVFWVTLGESPDLVSVQRTLARQLGEEPSFSNPIDGLRDLRRFLGSRRCLVVVDDAWSTAAAEALAATSGVGRVLYTTRDASILAAVAAAVQPVDVLDPAASFAFLEAAVGQVADTDRAVVEGAIAQTGGVILALSLVAGAVRAGGNWTEMTTRLEGLARVFRDHPYADVFKTMRVAVDHLAPVDAERYFLLGVFPEDVSVPHTTVGRLWGIDDPGPILARLVDAGLLSSEDGQIRFHDLQRSFLVFAATQPWALLHRHLLDRHRPGRGWAYLPDGEAYLWDHLLHHLQMAGDHHEMAAVVTNGRWLARRLHRNGVYPAEADLARVAAVRPEDARVLHVLALLRRWAGLFRGDLSVTDVAATLISRLPSAEPDVADLLGPIWLQPAWPLPDASQALLRTLAGHTRSVQSVAFAPDGLTLASAGADGTVRLWDPATGALYRTLTGHADAVNAVAFSPDGHILASGSADDTVRLWDPMTGDMLRTLAGHADSVNAVAFSPDGHILASGSADNTVRLWDPATGDVLRTLSGHTRWVQSVAFAADGRTMASAGLDSTVRLWDPATGELLHTVSYTWKGHSIGHTDWVHSVAFAPDEHTWRPAAPTTPCACGIPPPGSSWAPWASIPIGFTPWPSPATGTPSHPPAETTS